MAPANPPHFTARLRGIAAVIVMFQTSLLASILVLLPSLLLLLVPGDATTRVFIAIANQLQSAWLSMALVLLHYLLGMKIAFHTRDERVLSSLRCPGDALIISNHRTRLDWMFLWGLGAAMGRLGNLKIVLKSGLRKVPGFGWATQCFGFAFMQRANREGDLATLRNTVAFQCQTTKKRSGAGGKLAMLLFPEGTDLSESNVEKSNAFADKNGLPRYIQVLHPKTAGFAAVWDSLQSCSSNARIIDATIAYCDYSPGERPSESSVFLKGRFCKEVHILVEEVQHLPQSSKAGEVDAFCKELFSKKDAQLTRFYAPCAAGGQSDLAPFGDTPLIKTLLPDVEGVKLQLACGCLYMMAVEAAWFGLFWYYGALISGLVLVSGGLAFHRIENLTGGVDQLLLRRVPEQKPDKKSS